ncbi:MAG: hypothetical protein ACXWXO_18520, partial [Nocardioides sp.]
GPQVNSGSAYGTVAYLSPGSGAQVGTGSSVTMYISNGTPESSGGGGGDGGGDGGGGGDGRGGGGNDKPGNGRGRGNR